MSDGFEEQLESPDPLQQLLRRVEELEWRVENLERASAAGF